MRPFPTPRPLAFSGGLPAGAAWAVASAALRPLRRLLGASMVTAAAGAAGLAWLPSGGEAVVELPSRLAAPPAPARATVPAARPAVVAAAPLDLAETLVVVPPAAATDSSTVSGEASYYASKFEGRRTASGEPYRGSAMTAAHRTLPFGTRVRVTNPRNGRSVVVRINDRGPFHPRRVIDVSRTAAVELGILRRGRDLVELEVLGRSGRG
jgi:rare lipoprotein A